LGLKEHTILPLESSDTSPVKQISSRLYVLLFNRPEFLRRIRNLGLLEPYSCSIYIMESLKGKVIAVTGAAGGIGSVTAAFLASKGASLSLADMDAKALDQVAEEIRSKYQSDVITTKLDVSNTEQVDGWITSTIRHFAKLSGAVNLAGTVGREFGLKLVHEVTDSDFDLVMAINVRGLMACQRAQLRHIEDGGSIVNTASVSGKMGMPKTLSYAASKHAVIGLTRVAAAENGHRNVRVNAIAP